MQESKNGIVVINPTETFITYIARIQQMQNLRCRGIVVFSLYPLPMGNNVIFSQVSTLDYCTVAYIQIFTDL